MVGGEYAMRVSHDASGEPCWISRRAAERAEDVPFCAESVSPERGVAVKGKRCALGQTEARDLGPSAVSSRVTRTQVQRHPLFLSDRPSWRVSVWVPVGTPQCATRFAPPQTAGVWGITAPGLHQTGESIAAGHSRQNMIKTNDLEPRRCAAEQFNSSA